MSDPLDDAIAIGCGPGGSSAATFLAKAGRRVLVLEREKFRISVSMLLGLVFLGGCRIAPPMPPVDLQSSAWSVRQGQAVWTAKSGEDGVAGELLVATRTGGACFVQFAKPPFTLATAQAEPRRWTLHRMSARRVLSGRGPAPTRLVWFALAEALRGQSETDAWVFQSQGGDGWCLTNRVTGETLAGHLSP